MTKKIGANSSFQMSCEI
uniref:Uncharacterized protein n=1 Tax=Arundo donax TaxID=35708 RepID=A0A0A9HDA4_ARUDO